MPKLRTAPTFFASRIGTNPTTNRTLLPFFIVHHASSARQPGWGIWVGDVLGGFGFLNLGQNQ